MDDCGGEMMGHVMNLLMANGAREVHYTPIYTKKNRPAYTLTVICKESEREKLENLIFSDEQLKLGEAVAQELEEAEAN